MSQRDFRYHLLSIGVNREANGATVRAAERDAFGMSWTFAQLGYWRAESNRCLTGSQTSPAAIATHLGRCGEVGDVDLLFLFWSGYLQAIDPLVGALDDAASARQRVLIVDTCQAEKHVRELVDVIGALPDTRRPVVLASCTADGRARENSLHGFFTGALLRQLRRSRRPGARSLDLLDAFNRATDEAVPRTGSEPLFTTNGAGRLRIPILTQTELPFED